MIKAVFLDFDYTIYSHKKKQIPASAKEAILNLHKAGIKVFLATGRNLEEMSLFPEYKELGFDGYILLNGQICLDGNLKRMFGTPLNKTAEKAVVDLFNSKTQPIVLIEENDNYLNFMDPIIGVATGELACLEHKVKPYSGNPIYLAVAYITPEQESDLLKKLPGCCFKRWSDCGVDIVNEGVDKATAIQRCMEILGLRKEECLAVGDSYNDLDMLKAVGTGIAMGNAVDELKAEADYVTDDIDNDGLAKVLKKTCFRN